MTTPKINTISRGGARLYVHPETNEQLPGVTSVLNMLPKPFLQYWAANKVAECAVNHLGEVVGIAMTDRKAAIDFLKRAPQRDVKQAAERGDDVHDLYERLAKGEKVSRRMLDEELRLYYDHWHAFKEKFDPNFLHIEATIWSETLRTAGSFDWIAELTDPDTGDRVVTIGDNKTTRSGVHAEVAIQLAVYSRGDCILLPDGSELPLPKIEAGAVLHARPDGAKVVPVDISDDVVEVFTHLRAVMDWERDLSKRVLGYDIPLNTVHPKGTKLS